MAFIDEHAVAFKTPGWLAQIERRTAPKKFYATMAAFAFVVGLMTSAIISRWLFLPGLLLTAALLWFIAINAQHSRWIPTFFILSVMAFATLALFLTQEMCVVSAAARGVRRQREQQAMELLMSSPPSTPPPPPPPAAPPRLRPWK
ncbi:hypothetical protein [Streptomyces sp. TRM68416]|uniref:hypothetical protein n=1 Tax=Streptomyces sp. TRM68416 TaxID=2758412 RepID=UPI0016620275|nr:hypothetical protein [Streptomyces sp. TRM68416]MBD0842749.1 hypothetical protein [Streptomyces sp. TRM68416]